MKPEFKKNATIGELYGPAMDVTDPIEAATYFEALVEYGMSHDQTREQAEQVQRSNLGYFSGYSNVETQRRVERLFGAVHPIFGSVGGDTEPKTAEETLHGWRTEALAHREKLLADNPPIKSGTMYEIGCHHAEWNVISNAAARGVATAGAWLIVTGEPCILCAKLIHHAGITKVLCVRGGFMGGDAGPVYLRQHGVEVEYVEGPQDPRKEQS